MRIDEKRPPKDTVQEPETLRKTELMKKSGGVKLFYMLTGKTNNSHKSFVDSLMNQVEDLREVPTVDESDIFLVYCPVVSRHDINLEAALKRFTDSTASKLKVLVVLHNTFDPEKTVPDSSRCVNRTDILTVDCLFYEDTGLLKCQKNDDAIDKVVHWLRQQAKSKGVNEYPPKNKSTFSTNWTQRMKLGSSSNRTITTARTSTAAATSLTSAAPYAQPMSFRTVKYFVTLPGNRQ
ncbi:uncharacterized protein LOC130418976 [Triplophysa dalaica]|uniref:uncharacterized protein LOC130418976 n=1 Tax=Triplophysa dalaica TaxID=1582913 RepID=UPI0024DF3592|nr:uncharacterized protein LOC130418976 [Triplophysa dalaica]